MVQMQEKVSPDLTPLLLTEIVIAQAKLDPRLERLIKDTHAVTRQYQYAFFNQLSRPPVSLGFTKDLTVVVFQDAEKNYGRV